ncbi:MAG: amino acid permease, partial [Myxococcota bacterium]|nr:amino acid permease [Myxococcota bacterium]
MKTLERRLGLWSVVIISISAMLSGVFVLPGLAVGMTGGSAWLAFLVVAICILPAALSKAELASALPQSGGAYVFINRAFGPLTGTIMGLGLWSSLLFKSAFSLVGFGAYLGVLDENSSTQTLALGLLAVITLLNLTGIKKVSQFQTVVVVLSLSALAVLTATGIPVIDATNFQPHFRHGVIGFSEAVAFVFISYAGVTKVAAIAGEVTSPGKNLPLAIIIALALITPIYCLVVFALNGVLSIEALEHNIHPIYSMAEVLLGPTGAYITAIVAILTMTSMANAGLLASSRFPFAMSRDGLIPRLFGYIHQRYLTPTYCILLTSMVMAIAVSFMDLERIAKLGSVCMLLAFGFNNVALIILRESKADWYKPTYRAPLYPGLPIIGVVVSLVLLIAMGKMALYTILGITVAGCLLFFLYGHKRHSGPGVLGKLGLRGDLLATYSPENHDASQILSPEATSVVALIGRERKSVEMLTQMGAALGARKGADVVHITEVPDQMALDELLEEEPWVNALRRRVLGMREMAKINVKFGTMVSHDVVGTVHDLSSRMHCEWVVMSWRPYRLFNPLGWLYNNLPNDLAIFKDASIRYIRRILILTEPGPQDLILAESAHNLARYYRASITFVRFIPVDASEAETQHARGHLQYIQSVCDSESKTLLLRGSSQVDT